MMEKYTEDLIEAQCASDSAEMFEWLEILADLEGENFDPYLALQIAKSEAYGLFELE